MANSTPFPYLKVGEDVNNDADRSTERVEENHVRERGQCQGAGCRPENEGSGEYVGETPDCAKALAWSDAGDTLEEVRNGERGGEG